MVNDINLSIIQLIKSGEISTNYEISRLKAGQGININIRSFLDQTDYYSVLKKKIRQAENELSNANDIGEELHRAKLSTLQKVEEDYIVSTLYLAETLARINPRSDKLQKAIALFETGKIKEADEILSETDLLDDQHSLILFVECQRPKLNLLKNDLFDSLDKN